MHILHTDTSKRLALVMLLTAAAFGQSKQATILPG